MVNSFLFDIADAEFEVADFGVGEFGLKFGEDFLFLECELLDRHGVGDGDFECAAAEAAGEGVFGEGGADGGGPSGTKSAPAWRNSWPSCCKGCRYRTHRRASPKKI